MAINVKFDLFGNPEQPTIILATRSGNKLGQLNAKGIEISDKLNDASEMSFVVNKYVDGKLTNLWDKIVDFKLVHCKEWDLWFEISVELDEETETVKTVMCTQLGQAELSQLMLYNIEINTEDDIARDDYKISILYKDNDDNCILNRLLKDKAPHYHIEHVDSTIANLQRSFSFDGTSIYDTFQEIAEEIGCLFVFHSGTDSNGKIQRAISVYDLQQNCSKCNHRGEFINKCPECDSTNIKYGYGEDTLIFVTSDELAADGIQFTTDIDSVKNCFKLEAGDDLMTATVRNCNPNGTDYIWYFSDNVKEDMSEELVDKIESYNEEYKYYYNEYKSNLDTKLVTKYNELVNKYSKYKEELELINVPISGYSSLMNVYYNTVDLSLYLQSGLMPSVKMSDTNAEEQAKLLTASYLSPVAVADIDIVSLATANSSVLAMAKVIVKSTFKVEIKENSSSLYNSGNKKYWKGKFVITNYSDEEDTAESNEISVQLNDDLESYVKQKIEKALNKENTDDLSITGLFKKEYNDFCAELKKYALNPLDSFHSACQACIDILIEQDAGNESKKDLYDNLYTPYYNKLKAIESEMKIREDEINIINGVYDEETGELITSGIRTNIEKVRNIIQDALNFEEYIGTDLWLEFCAYRREDKYSNDNYISDGLNNSELFDKALEFIKVAEDEIYKSAELQHSISTSLKNLLAIPKFKVLVEHFNVGNWLRIRVNDEIYKLRLLEYDIDFDDFESISVVFSDVMKIKNGISDTQGVLEQAKSMATSYDSIKKQAKQGNEAQVTINNWLSNGLNSALVQIQNNGNEEITIGKNGLLCRSYNDVTDTFMPEQFRLTHNIMAYTTDGWKTVSAALGKHEYTKWKDNQWVKGEDYGLSSTFVTAGYVTGSQIIGGEIISSNYESGKSGTYMNIINGDFELAGGKINYNAENNLLTLKDVTINWDTTNDVPTSSVAGLNDIIDNLEESTKTYTDNEIKTLDNAVGKYLGLSGGTLVGSSYVISPYIGGGYLNITNSSNNAKVIIDPNNLTKSGYIFQVHNGSSVSVGITKDGSASFSGKITATSGEIGGWTIGTNKIYAGDKDVGVCVMQRPTSSTTYVFAAGGADHSNYSDCPFRVTKAGKLYATDAEIKGKVTASSGSITGNLTVSGSLTHTSGNYTVTLRAVQSDKSYGVFYITDKSSGENKYPFIVKGDGSFTATKANITGDSTFGGTLNGADGTFKGTLSAVTGTFTKLTAGKSTFTTNQVIVDASYKNSSGEEISKGSIYIGRSGVDGWEDITIRPSSDNLGNIGTASHSWDMLYVKNGAVHSSDRNCKTDITEMGEKQERFFNLLSPVTFKFIDSSYDRYHYGFIAQDVEDAIYKCGLTTKDFAGFCKDIKQDSDGHDMYDEHGNPLYTYALRYTEFIALNSFMIKKLNNKILELENKLKKLEK